MKQCTVCNEHKELSDFYRMSASKDGHSYRCKVCDNAARKRWEVENPEQAARSNRERQLRKRYGIDVDTYDKMFEQQGCKCAICGSTENATGGSRTDWNFSVDHCHNTGQIRGLLCNNCNRALGLFKDSKELLKNAISYLDTH